MNDTRTSSRDTVESRHEGRAQDNSSSLFLTPKAYKELASAFIAP